MGSPFRAVDADRIGIGRHIGDDIGPVVDLGHANGPGDVNAFPVGEAMARGGHLDRAIRQKALAHLASVVVAIIAGGVHRHPGRAVPGLQGEFGAADHLDPIGAAVHLLHAPHVPDPHIVVGLQSMGGRAGDHAGARAGDAADVPCGRHGPGHVRDGSGADRSSAGGVGVGAHVDADGIGHHRHAGIVRRLDVLNHQIDKVPRCGLHRGDPAAGHGTGDVQDQGDLEVLGRAVDLGVGPDRQVIVHEFAVGRQEDVGHQSLHIDPGTGDHHGVVIQ